jgi:predicted PurR-regulated permease PerM
MGNSETEGSPLFGKPVEGRKLIELAYLIVILAVFALAKEFLLPLVLAILISFLLAPAVSRLERWRFPGVIAILNVVGIAFALILTLALYGFLEVFTNNVVEPFVLGGSTGMSPLAIIVSALFWTWLWGPIGLLLATPLTACLVVLGRYFPAFHICSVLLAAKPPTSAETKFIRFLTEGRLPEARALL